MSVAMKVSHCNISLVSAIVTVIIICFASIAALGNELQTYNVEPTTISLSGISSGAFMAVQMHIAYSSYFVGAGLIAGGPFFCAQDNVNIALSSCMTTPELISVTELVTITHNTMATGFIDSTKNLADQRLAIFSGSKDSVIHQGVVQKLEEYYTTYVSSSAGSIYSNYTIPSEHAWITDNYGNECDYLGSPFINNCGVDAAGIILNQIYEDLVPRVAMKPSNLLTFSQGEFVPGLWIPAEVGIGAQGYVYVPDNCQSKDQVCRLHIALHGCEQSAGYIGDTFAMFSGLNDWAEANDIIVLYPQANKTLLNPKACWDWWGYTGPNYASNTGIQMVTLKNMLDRVLGI